MIFSKIQQHLPINKFILNNNGPNSVSSEMHTVTIVPNIERLEGTIKRRLFGDLETGS